MEQIPRITAEVTGAPDDLAKNIKGKLSTFTQESFEDFNSALPQLRSLSNQAAQAVGYYNAEFRFEKLSASRVRVKVTQMSRYELMNKILNSVELVQNNHSFKLFV